MKTRRVFKEKFTNKIMQDCTGEELEFPEVDKNDYPEVGDKVLLDGKKATGERLMPNESLIKFQDGVVTHIIPPPENKENIKTVKAIKDGVCKTFNGWKDNQKQKIEILGANASTPFRKRNRVLVNGKAMKAAKCEISGKRVTILNGRISEVKSMSQSGSRDVFKRNTRDKVEKPVNRKIKGENKRQSKKMIGIPVSKAEEAKAKKKNWQVSNNHKFIACADRTEKIKFMKNPK